jgi:hypothetical protein
MAGMDWGAILGPRGLEAPGYRELVAKIRADRENRPASPAKPPKGKPKGKR